MKTYSYSVSDQHTTRDAVETDFDDYDECFRRAKQRIRKIGDIIKVYCDKAENDEAELLSESIVRGDGFLDVITAYYC